MKEIVRTVPAEIEKKERLSLLYRKIQSFSYHVRTSRKGKKEKQLNNQRKLPGLPMADTW
ncbi:hypothetical protein K080096A4_23060 [[Clostridium] innocuum]